MLPNDYLNKNIQLPMLHHNLQQYLVSILKQQDCIKNSWYETSWSELLYR